MNERRMNFSEFVDRVKNSIKDYLPDRFADASVSVDQYQKLNTSYMGLQVRLEGQMVIPNVNLNAHFAEYQKRGLSMENVMRGVAEQVQMAPNLHTEWLKDYNQVKAHLFIRVSDAKKSEPFLQTSPHKEVDGLAISYHIAFEGMQGVEASTPISNKMMEMYDVTAEQLHADALESSQRLYPVQFSSLAEVMQQMMGLDPEMAADMMPPVEGPQLMILTNAQSFYGASALFYPGQMEAIAEQVGSDFFVLPSSVHETLILADDGSVEPDSLQFMVREINQTEVAPEDRLSDFVYHYDAQDHVLEKAETFAAKKKKKEQESEKTALKEPEQQEKVGGENGRDASEKTDRQNERRLSHAEEREAAGGRQDRKSVLGRLNEKKEQVKGQPKKGVPPRAQEASI